MTIDTQVQCNVLSKRSYDNMKTHANLRLCRTESTITAFGNSVVSPVGKTRFETIVKGHRYALECEVVDGEVPNLLGAVGSERLGLVRRVHAAARQIGSENVSARESKQGISESVPHSVREIINEYQDVFKGVGKVATEVSLKVDPNYTPVSMEEVITSQLVTDPRIIQLRQETREDEELQLVMQLLQQPRGWPEERREVPSMAKPYFDYKEELNVI